MDEIYQKTGGKDESKVKERVGCQEQRRLMEELMCEKECLLAEKREMWNMIEAEMKRILMAMQLHLELKPENIL